MRNKALLSQVNNLDRLSHQSFDKILRARNPMWKEVGSSVTKRLDHLYGVPIGEFELTDIAFLIRQDIGVPFLMDRALTALDENPFICVQYYEGDLCDAVL